jgi:hypothetical protein
VFALESLAPLGASLRLARVHARAARSALREKADPATLRVDATLDALDDRLSAAVFRFQSSFHRARDWLAGIFDRSPRASEMPSSTALAYGAVGIMAVILAKDLIGATPAVSSVASTPAPRPDWVEIVRPHGLFALESPVLDVLERRYTAHRHRDGGGRKDEFTFGAPGARGPYARVSLYRPGTEGMANPDPLEAVVSVAADSAIDAELQETHRSLKTKFGVLPLVAMTVSGGDRVRSCVATAAGWSDPRLGLVAWWCNDGPELVAHGEFACLIDRLALMSAGGDDRLAEFFAKVELRRSQCSVHGTVLSPTPKRPDDWIHAKQRPQLRGRFAGR